MLEQATKIFNQTSRPVNQTTTTIEKKTEPVGKVPLPSNQTKLSPIGNLAKLPPMSNKTTVTPTGKVTTTVIDKTSTPINVSRPHQGLQLTNRRHPQAIRQKQLHHHQPLHNDKNNQLIRLRVLTVKIHYPFGYW
ncbi:MAG: hypothetical protein WCF06_08895 [Nitrososphaeraceae archaeon]